MEATPFTPLEGLLGGALIGLASALLLWTDGKVAGISGILSRALVPTRGDFAWRLAFLVGLPLGAALVVRATSDVHGFAITASWPTLIAGGLLVGFGTALGNGCTSGHGVCGIARGSKRSVAATATFMASAIAATFVLRHVLGAA
ncbi:MAG: YeeE/YedE family protein [Deltaproteobacteria bacterium]|nr:YeeE/YedE family protein [Deltaproteobacteria bacterium]